MLNEKLCNHAWNNISFSPEKRASDFKESHAKMLEYIKQAVTERALHDKQRDIAPRVIDDLTSKYTQLCNDYLHATSNCISSAITGPANFPTQKAQRSLARQSTANEALVYFTGNIIKIIEKRLGAVFSTQEKQASAVDDLKQQLEERKKSQEFMKTCNAAYRKYEKGGQQALATYSAEVKTAVVSYKPDYRNKPFPAYMLTNNNANIKRIESRIKELEQKQQAETKEHEFSFCKVVENAEADRLQLIFDGKPDDNVRALLKKHGYRWSPRYNAWQRKLTDNARFSFTQYIAPGLRDLELTAHSKEQLTASGRLNT